MRRRNKGRAVGGYEVSEVSGARGVCVGRLAVVIMCAGYGVVR